MGRLDDEIKRLRGVGVRREREYPDTLIELLDEFLAREVPPNAGDCWWVTDVWDPATHRYLPIYLGPDGWLYYNLSNRDRVTDVHVKSWHIDGDTLTTNLAALLLQAGESGSSGSEGS